MKTAVDWLVDHLYLVIPNEEKNFLEGLRIEALKKEKEQIITDYSNGLLYALGYKHEDKNIEYSVIMQSKAEADIYYNQTYNQNK